MTGQKFAEALRAIADWYEGHPEVPGPEYPEVGISMLDGVTESPELAEGLARALAPCRKEYGDSTLALSRTFDGVKFRFVFWRASVCTRRVVGVEEVAEQVVPAHTREIVEWDCSPLLKESDV